VDVDHRARREVPVAVRIEGSPAAGFAWRGVTIVLPPVVRVRGPRAALAHLDTLRLAPIRIDGRRDTVRVDAAIPTLPDWCVAEPPVVRVKVALQRR
jgi:hypothetical protein